MSCTDDINALSSLENDLIKLYSPPLNWSRIIVKKTTPVETALQQSLQQLAKFNTMILGFDPVADEQRPTIYLVYPVNGRRGLSGSIRVALKNINEKASVLEWKEYYTDPESLGKFGYWMTEYNGIRIDLSPLQGLAHFMNDSTLRTLAGVELMAFSSEQLEILKEDILCLVEDDPIPIEPADRNIFSMSSCSTA